MIIKPDGNPATERQLIANDSAKDIDKVKITAFVIQQTLRQFADSDLKLLKETYTISLDSYRKELHKANRLDLGTIQAREEGSSGALFPALFDENLAPPPSQKYYFGPEIAMGLHFPKKNDTDVVRLSE